MGAEGATARWNWDFLKHMLELLVRHARLDLKIKAEGDLKVDDHHLTEDMGITLGLALDQALGEKRGISRYGSVLMPMDEVLGGCGAGPGRALCLLL